MKAFIAAAGKGTRLRPYTDHCPKPLVRVQGKPIIDYNIDALRHGGVRDITVNLHYKADQIEDHLLSRPDLGDTTLHFSHEDSLLDTGGGIKKALPHLGNELCNEPCNEPFWALNGDTIWTDYPVPHHLDQTIESAMQRMRDLWDDAQMDLLLLLFPLEKLDTPGTGDYDLDHNGIPRRNLDRKGRYMWTSLRLCHPRLFNDTPNGAFSFRDLMDKAQQNGRLAALVHTGHWYHISTADDLQWIETHAALAPLREGL